MFCTRKIIFNYSNILVKCLNTSKTSRTNWTSNNILIVQQSKSYNLLKSKLNDFVAWYEEFTGMDEVRLAQNRVLEAEEKFRIAQERRRENNLALLDIQQKLKDIHTELDTTGRGEDKYVQLITEESKILKQEKRLQAAFQLAEKDEREYFANLSSSVKESHEKERAQAERTKYWSIIGSILGTVIGIVGSSINNRLKMSELRQLIIESNPNALLESLTQAVHDNSNEVQRLEKLIEDKPENRLVKSLYDSMEQERIRTTTCIGLILGISIFIPIVMRCCC